MARITPAAHWALLAAVLAVLWAGSVYTPWAPDLAPRLWLYDLVFYLRFALLALWLAAVLRLAFGDEPRQAPLMPLALVAVATLLACAAERSAPGIRLRVLASGEALERLADAHTAVRRQRAGHFLVDGSSTPCDARQRWLWLGRPHGAGSGTSVALVRSEGMPMVPPGDAHRLRRVGGAWWMAYQHAARFASATRGPCVRARTVPGHADGRAFVADGWRQPPTAGPAPRSGPQSQRPRRVHHPGQ